jgi:hypothetical protein
MSHRRRAFGSLLVLALHGSLARAQAAPPDEACREGARPIRLSRPFVETDTVRLLSGELLADDAGGRGRLTIDYLSRARAGDTLALRREADALARALTATAGGTPFAALTLRACARAGVAPLATYSFAQGADSAWTRVEFRGAAIRLRGSAGGRARSPRPPSSRRPAPHRGAR